MNSKKEIMLTIGVVVMFVVLGVLSFMKIEGNIRFLMLFLYLLLFASVVVKVISIERNAKKEIDNVTYVVERHGNDIFTNMPIGIVSINSAGIILWVNKYFEALFEESVEMRSVTELFPNILDDLSDEPETIVDINDEYYKAVKSDGAIFFFNDSERVEFKEKYQNEKLVMGAISFDNYEDYYNSLDEQRSNEVTSYMSKMINEWCSEFGIYLRKYSNSRYLMIMNENSLKKAIDNHFSILESIRNYGNRTKLPLTISMSIANDNSVVSSLAETVFDGLDLVLSRGGDQTVVKSGSGKVEYYGGKTDAVEKRNRAKARMFSGSVANLVRNSKHIIVMGHKDADFDSIGGCVGMSKLALELNPNVCVALDKSKLSASSRKLVEELNETTFYSLIKHPDDAYEEMTRETLLIVVDTHKKHLVESEKILEESRNTIVIDHHRRGDDIIENPILSYIEPYASSTSELVTELIDFQLTNVEISSLEATAMLAGIIMDTKSFIYRTGNRTFDAAATLKSKGADTIVIQDLLKEEMNVVIKRNNLISNIEMVGDGCAITSISEIVSQVILAQAADEILKIEGVKAAFVLGKFDENTVSLSARSVGEINVQVVAEKLGGGGHMTSAAARVDSDNVGEVVNRIEDILIGGDFNESDISD